MLTLFLVVVCLTAFFLAVKRRRRVVARRDLLSTTFQDRTAGFPRLDGRGGP